MPLIEWNGRLIDRDEERRLTDYEHDPNSRPPPLQSAYWVQWWTYATPAQQARAHRAKMLQAALVIAVPFLFLGLLAILL
jgi:hypothetical protein